MTVKKQLPPLHTRKTGAGDISYLHYPAAAGAAGPAVVLLHATGFLPWLWHPVARELTDKSDVVVPWLAPRPADDPVQGGTSWLRLAREVSALVQALEITRPVVAGHSMGGVVAALAQACYPLSATRMVLLEPIFMPRELYTVKMTVEQHHLAAKALKRGNHWPDRAAARDYFLSRPLFARWDLEVLELYLQYGLRTTADGGVTLTCSPREEASLFMGCDARDPWSLIPQLSLPVLVVEGELTENKGFIDYEDLARKFPQGAYRQLRGAGHLIPMEKPRETLALLREWL